MDSQAKDEFLHVPGMGFTDSELRKGEKSFDRVHRLREDGLARNQGIKFERIKDSPLEKSELLMRINTPPPIPFTDLKEKVTSRITYNTLPFKASYDFIRLNSQSFLVPVTLSFDPAAVSFQLLDGSRAGAGASVRLVSQLWADVDAKYFRLSRDRNIMRLAIFEMLHREDIPPVYYAFDNAFLMRAKSLKTKDCTQSFKHFRFDILVFMGHGSHFSIEILNRRSANLSKSTDEPSFRVALKIIRAVTR